MQAFGIVSTHRRKPAQMKQYTILLNESVSPSIKIQKPRIPKPGKIRNDCHVIDNRPNYIKNKDPAKIMINNPRQPHVINKKAVRFGNCESSKTSQEHREYVEVQSVVPEPIRNYSHHSQQNSFSKKSSIKAPQKLSSLSNDQSQIDVYDRTKFMRQLEHRKYEQSSIKEPQKLSSLSNDKSQIDVYDRTKFMRQLEHRKYEQKIIIPNIPVQLESDSETIAREYKREYHARVMKEQPAIIPQNIGLDSSRESLHQSGKKYYHMRSPKDQIYPDNEHIQLSQESQRLFSKKNRIYESKYIHMQQPSEQSHRQVILSESSEQMIQDRSKGIHSRKYDGQNFEDQRQKVVLQSSSNMGSSVARMQPFKLDSSSNSKRSDQRQDSQVANRRSNESSSNSKRADEQQSSSLQGSSVAKMQPFKLDSKSSSQKNSSKQSNRNSQSSNLSKQDLSRFSPFKF